MSELWLVAAWLLGAPALDLYTRVQALAKAPSPAAIHALLVETVDRQALIERILIDVKGLDGPGRERLAEAVLTSLELRATRGLSDAQFSCDVERAVEADDSSGKKLKLACNRGESQVTIELLISPAGRIYDASLEGALLSRNLRAQINKGLRVNGLDEVVRRLEHP